MYGLEMSIWQAAILSFCFVLLMAGFAFGKRQKYADGQHSADRRTHGRPGDGHLWNEAAHADEENFVPARRKRWQSCWSRTMINRRANTLLDKQPVTGSERRPAARQTISSNLSKSMDLEHDGQPFATVSYEIPANDLRVALQTLHSRYPTYWSHKLYRGPDGQRVIVQYCRTRAESETVARSFLDEEVIGFDMEWKCPESKGLKNNISLIQIACEKRVALFHLALHYGDSVDQLFAPSLRAIIEAPKPTKVGVAILNADGARLKRFCGIKPRGLFELSHLYRLVKYASTPELIVKRLVSLATQVEEHLQLPLLKDNVRTSDWTKPLTEKQIEYAANDAYCGFMLYHVMESKRMTLRPIPPRPAHAELYQPIRLADILQVSQDPHAQVGDLKHLDHRVTDGSGILQDGIQHRAYEKLDVGDVLLLDALHKRREELSQAQNVPALEIASDRTLEELARLQPCDLKGLKKVYDIDDVKASRYGFDWLRAIRNYALGNPISLFSPVNASTEEANALGRPHVQRQRHKAAQRSNFLTGLQLDQPARLADVTPFVDQIPTIVQPTSSAATETLLQHNTPASKSDSYVFTPRSNLSTEQFMPAPRLTSPQFFGSGIRQQVHILPPGFDAVARQVFSALCALRIRLSQKSNLRREFIASDSTLKELAARRPHDSQGLKIIPGGSNFALLARQHGVELLDFIEKRAPATQHVRQPLGPLQNVQKIAPLGQRSPQEEATQQVELIDLTGDDVFSETPI